MTGTHWPEDVEVWLRAHPLATYTQYAAEWGEARSLHAFRQKRWKMGLPGMTLTQLVQGAPYDVVTGAQTVAEDAPDEAFEHLFDLLEQVDDTIATLSPTQETTDFHAPDDGLPIGIAFTGDWHLGASGVEVARLKQDLQTIVQTPGLYAVAMGDLVEGVNIHTKAASALYSGLINDGNLQERYALMRLSIAAGKWLALVSGNHDEWLKRSSGVSRLDRLAQQLGVRGQRPPHFCQGGGTIFVHVGEQRYVVAVTHNAKGNSALNTTNAQRRSYDAWPQWENCDAICCGHLHFPDHQRAYRKGGFCEYLRSGTYKLRDGYAADHGFKPGYGVPMVIAYPDRHYLKGWPGDDFEGGVRFLQAERQRYSRQ